MSYGFSIDYAENVGIVAASRASGSVKQNGPGFSFSLTVPLANSVYSPDTEFHTPHGMLAERSARIFLTFAIDLPKLRDWLYVHAEDPSQAVLMQADLMHSEIFP